jgi:hypothetical protein
MVKAKKPAQRRASKPAGVRGAAPGLFAADPRIDGRMVAVYETILARYGHRPEVTGVDIGLERKGGLETGRLAVRIHVREKLKRSLLAAREVFPKRIGGVRVDIIEAQYARHAGTGPWRVDTLQPGVSIGHSRTTAGTLGVFIRDEQQRLGLLSASHVLVPDTLSNPGDPILQPGRSDGGTAPGDTVATVGRFDLRTDSAFALLNGTRGTDARVAGTNAMIGGTRMPVVGDILTKSGRSTQVTQAKVDGVAGPYFGIQFSFRLVPADPAVLMCDLGDSGSVWYDAATGEGVGLHCLGPSNPTLSNQFGVASSLAIVLQRLRISL